MICLPNTPTGCLLKPNKMIEMKKTKKKRPLVLIEVLIAISLLALLSAFLFMALRQTMAWSHLNEEASRNEEVISNAHQLLARVFSGAVIEETQNVKDEEDQRFFFTVDSPTSLVFTFNNGVDRDPKFSNVVLGKIYLDHHHHLCLAIWPLPNRWKSFSPDQVRHVILLDHISSLQFSFYHPPQSTPPIVQPQEIQTGKMKKNPLPGEQNVWLQDYQQLPSIVKLIVVANHTKSPEKVVFSYLLPSTEKTIFIADEGIKP
jgi:type II secretory pathway pseudopilin PulG